jgi:C4-type Zn-finger protein
MEKQTAVEWLIDRIENSINTYENWQNVKEEAKKMEKQYLIDELEDVLYEDDKIDFDDPNYRKSVIEYGLNKVNNLKKELYAKS